VKASTPSPTFERHNLPGSFIRLVVEEYHKGDYKVPCKWLVQILPSGRVLYQLHPTGVKSPWPTPTCHKSGGVGTPGWKDLRLQKAGVIFRENGATIQMKLENAVALASPEDEQKYRDGGHLSAHFVEWLMSFPHDWTALK
jgi:hypothetical protein